MKPKEDGRHNEFDPNKDSSRAGNKQDGVHAERRMGQEEMPKI